MHGEIVKLVRQDLTLKCTKRFGRRQTRYVSRQLCEDLDLKRFSASSTQKLVHNNWHANKHFNLNPNFLTLLFLKHLSFILYIVNWTKFATPAASTATFLD
jgi:hypothetical protein